MFRSPSKCQSSPDLASDSDKPTKAQRKRKQPESELATAIDSLTHDLNKKLDAWGDKLNCAISRITETVVNIKSELTNIAQVTTEIKQELNGLRADQDILAKKMSGLESNHQALVEDVADLQKAVQFAMCEQTDLKEQITSVYDNTKNCSAIKNDYRHLETKIDSLEQQARQCNLEICNVPEKRNENLLSILENICAKIKFSFCQKDVVAIHRVPHAHSESKNPKNIIVKLNSRTLRDNLLSAYRLAKGLTTEQLGYAGNCRRLYMHEHLTLKRKELFRYCKEAASKNNFKYVWVKHATILVRETDTAPAIAIRTSEDLFKIKPAG